MYHSIPHCEFEYKMIFEQIHKITQCRRVPKLHSCLSIDVLIKWIGQCYWLLDWLIDWMPIFAWNKGKYEDASCPTCFDWPKEPSSFQSHTEPHTIPSFSKRLATHCTRPRDWVHNLSCASQVKNLHSYQGLVTLFFGNKILTGLITVSWRERYRSVR